MKSDCYHTSRTVRLAEIIYRLEKQAKYCERLKLYDLALEYRSLAGIYKLETRIKKT